MKKFKLHYIILICVLLLTSCATNQPVATEESQAHPSTNQEEAAKGNEEAWPRTVVDQLGREVTIEAKPERIASSYYISTAMLVALEAEENLVGIEMKAPTRELYKRSAPDIINLPVVGSGKTINVEECLALKTDLVIIPFRLKEFIPKFEALNIPVIAVKPETQELFLESVDLLGKATGTEARATEFMDYYKSKVVMAEGIAAKASDDKATIYLGGRGDILETCTFAMYQSDMIKLAGGSNASDELTDGYWATISIETLIDWNPDKIMIVNYAGYSKEQLVEDKRLTSVTAIKNEEIYTFPSDIEPWDYPTPSSILGILWLTHTLHPESYKAEDYYNEANSFYKTFFGFEVSKEDVGI